MTTPNGHYPSPAFLRAAAMFGNTRRIQSDTWNSEKNAYYCLISPDSVITTLNICRQYQISSMASADSWLETVTCV